MEQLAPGYGVRRLKRSYSLKKNSEFQYVYKAGKHYGSRTMSLVALRSRGGVRVGFSISKKVGNAVTRNKLKRRMRECVRPLLPRLKPCRLVFIARDALRDEPFAAVNNTIGYLLKKADILVKNAGESPEAGLGARREKR